MTVKEGAEDMKKNEMFWMMKEPIQIKEEHIKCVACGKPIHISEWAGVTKKGFYHSNAFCLMELAKEVDNRKKKIKSPHDKKRK